jgi:hypothetical protein
MKRIFIAAALCISLSAMATQPGNNGGGKGGCGVGQQTNGCGTPSNGGAGGQGGQGGAGGNAAAIAAAQARATAIAAQQQAQRQAQRQSQRQVVTNTNTVNGAPVNVSVSLPSATTPDTKTAATSETVKESAAAKTEAVVVPDVDRRPVNTAYAAPLTSSPETCMGSSSGGVQGASFGVSIASTWESVKCDRRMFARSLESLGKRAAAVAMLCLDDDVRKAMAAAGDACPGTDGKRAEDILNGRPVAAADVRLLP